MRLNKYISHAGICSRREADKFIQAGLVKINGVPITKMGYRVQSTDVVMFDGQKINPYKKRYLLLNKPNKFSSRIDNFGKKDSVFELIKKACKEKIFPVGRLDKNTSGLLIFTNDYQLSKNLSNPKNNIKKIYHVILDKPLKSINLKEIKTKMIIDNEKIIVDDISYVQNKDKTEIGIELKSNKVNIVKKIFKKLGYRIIKLDLVYFAGLTKKDIPRKKYRFLTTEEINLLKRL